MKNSELVILKELKNVLEQEKSSDDSIITLKDLSKLMNSKHLEYNNLVQEYNKYFKEKIGSDLDIKCNFNYTKEALILKIKSKTDKYYKTLIFTIENNNIVLQSKNSEFDNKLLVLKNNILKIYNEFMKFYDFMTDEVYFKNTINSKFEFTVYNSCIFINYRNDIGLLDKFDITYYSNNNIYEYDSGSEDITNLITNNEDKIFNNIYIDIKDCPKWSRDVLYKTRKEQLVHNKTKNLRIN